LPRLVSKPRQEKQLSRSVSKMRLELVKRHRLVNKLSRSAWLKKPPLKRRDRLSLNRPECKRRP
jgi:hypothetical protein